MAGNLEFRIQRYDDEINKLLDWADEGVAEGSKYPGMSYEEGVKAGVEWVLGLSDYNPKGED